MVFVLAQSAASDGVSVRSRLIGTAIVIGVALAVYWVATVAGRRYVARMTEREHERAARAATLWVVLRRVIQLVVFILVVLFVFIIWGLSITPFLGVGTILAAAIGFGAQDLVKDLISGFFILVEDQYHVGDTVTIAGTTGQVQDIQLRVTVLRDFEGNAHYVPNGQIEVTSNFTSDFAQPVLDVGVSYDTDVDRALEVMLDELVQLAGDEVYGEMITADPEMLGVHALADSSVVLRGRLTTRADSRWTVRREALRRVKKRFDAEGIVIPFPQVTISKAEGPGSV